MDIITVTKRAPTVKAKQLRRAGLVPANVFGGPLPDSIPLQMEEAVARRLVRTKREGSKLKLDMQGVLIPAQIKEKEVDARTNEILHISFQALAADQKVNSVIHILLKNADKMTETLEKLLMEIPYASLPEDMIDTLTIDLEGLPVDSAITVGDIPELVSGKIELQVEPSDLILRIRSKKRPGSTPLPAE